MPPTLTKPAETLLKETVQHEAQRGFSKRDKKFLKDLHISLDEAAPPLTRIRPEKPPLMERINNSFTMTAAMIFTGIAGGAVAMGEWAKDKGAWAAPLRALGRKMVKPHAALQGDIGHAASSAVENLARRIKSRGTETPEARAVAVEEASRLGDRVRFAENRVLEGANTLFNGLGTVAEQVTGKGPIGWARTRYVDHLQGRIAGSEAKAALHHERAIAHLDKTLAKLQGPELSGAREIVQNTRHTLIDTAKSLKDRHSAVNLAETGQKFDTVAQKLIKDKGLNAQSKAALNEASAGMRQFTKYANKTQGNFTAAAASGATVEALHNVKGAVAALPGKLAGIKLEHAPNYAWYALSQGASAIRSARAFTTRLDTLKNMYASVSGTDIAQVSGLKLALGLEKMPDSMKGAVKEYWKNALIDFGAQAGGMVVFHKINKPSGGANLLTMVAVQSVTAPITSLLTPKNSLLQNYRAIAEAHAAGGKVPKVAYAALIASAKPELRELSMNDPAMLQVAQHYAQTNAKASTVLKDMDSGLFDKLMADAKTAVAASTAKASSAKVPVGKFTGNLAATKPPAAIAPAPGSHLDRAVASKAAASNQAAL